MTALGWVASWRASRVGKAAAMARAKAHPTVGPAMARVGGLSAPSKMPGFSYGLPARAACPVGARLSKVPGSTCHGCYAAKGNYRYSNVQNAQAARLAALRSPSWVDDMTACIAFVVEATGEPFFRWHDSGDLQGVEHFRAIQEVARRLPGVKFWLPTKEYELAREARGLPDNLTVRVSAPMVGEHVPNRRAYPGGVTFATVTPSGEPLQGGSTCVAPFQGGTCGDCRKCWSRNVAEVNYRKH